MTNFFSFINGKRVGIASYLGSRFHRSDSLSILSRQSVLHTYSAESSCETFSVGQSSPLAFPFKAKSQLAFSHQSYLTILLLFLCLFIGSGNAWGANGSIKSFTSTSGNIVAGKITYATGSGESSNAPTTASNQLKLFRGGSTEKDGNYVTVTASDGYTITAIKFYFSSLKYKYSIDGGTATTTTAANLDLSSLSATSVKLQNRSTSQMFVTQIDVTYQSACASTLATPDITVTPTSGQVELTWPAIANATKYQLKWNGGSWTDAVSGVTKTGLSDGVEYTYQVKAIGNGSTICDSDPTESAIVIPGTYYDVTWVLNGNTYETTSVRSGTKPTFPDDPAPCDETSTTFMGWTRTGWSGKIDDVSDRTSAATKIYTNASDMPNVSTAVTYYAVFAKQDGGSPTSVTSYSAGNYYLIAKYSSDYYAMSGSATSGVTAVKVTSAVTYNSTPKTITVDPSSFTSEMIYAISGTTSEATITQAGTVVGNSGSGDFNRSGTWTISNISSAKTFRFSGNSRCIMFRSTPIFKNYSTSNAGNSGYGDGYLYLVPAPTYSKYLTNCCTSLGSINGSIFWNYFLDHVFSYLFTSFQRSFLAHFSAARWHYNLYNNKR